MKFCVIGLGVFGKNLARNFSALGAEVLALDRKEENVSAVKDEVGAAAVMDFSDPTPLGQFPINEMDAVIVAIGDSFESSMAMTVRAQELGARKLVCRVLSPMHERLLKLMKIDRLVVPEEFAARGLAQSLMMKGVVDSFDMGGGHAIIEAPVPAALVGRSLAQSAGVFKDTGVRLVTIKRPVRRALGTFFKNSTETQARRTLGVVGLDEKFDPDDIFVLFGPEKGLRAFLEHRAED